MADYDQRGHAANSGLAIAALILGIIAIVTAFIPIVNNVSFFIAIIDVVLAIIGIVATKNGQRGGRGMAVAGLVMGVLAIVVTLAVQAACSATLDQASQAMNDAVSGPQVSGTSSASTSSAPVSASGDVAGTASTAQPAAQTDAQSAASANLAVGTTASLDNGLSVTVSEVAPGLVNYDGSSVTAVRVTYANNGSAQVPFNLYDWKAQDANGVISDPAIFGGTDAGAEQLSSGQLAPGGSVSGTVYFDGTLTQVQYFTNMFNGAPTATWAVA